MTIDEELTASVVSRFTSISLHVPEPLHFYGAEVTDSPLPPPPPVLMTNNRLPGQHQRGER